MANSGIIHTITTIPVPQAEFEDEEFHGLVHGNSFPSSPVEKQLFYRDDLHRLYIYNGTSWLSLQDPSSYDLDDIGDVNVPTPSDEQGIEWDSATSKWILTSHMLSKLLTARGDIITRSSTIPKRLALGTEGHYLKAGANEPGWAALPTKSNVIWKDEPVRSLMDLNRSTNLDWTDLDLTPSTSADAKLALLMARISIDAFTDGRIYMRVRKNDTTPAYDVWLEASNPGAGQTWWLPPFLIGLDAGQVIEYAIGFTGTAQADFYLYTMGYVE